jgi:biotin carboxyl carrier protein
MQLEVLSEMVATVFRIEVHMGDTAEKDSILLILESMKMEIPVVAPASGMVADIRVAEGEGVAEGDVLAVIEVAS